MVEPNYQRLRLCRMAVGGRKEGASPLPCPRCSSYSSCVATYGKSIIRPPNLAALSSLLSKTPPPPPPLCSGNLVHAVCEPVPAHPVTSCLSCPRIAFSILYLCPCVSMSGACLRPSISLPVRPAGSFCISLSTRPLDCISLSGTCESAPHPYITHHTVPHPQACCHRVQRALHPPTAAALAPQQQSAARHFVRACQHVQNLIRDHHPLSSAPSRSDNSRPNPLPCQARR